MTTEPIYKTRKDNHDFMEPDHIAGFLRKHKTGVDNIGRAALVQILGSYVNPKVLDAACGTCVNYEVFRNLGLKCRYTGLDRTQKLLDHAKELYVPSSGTVADLERIPTLVHGYVEEMPFENGEFDVVVLRHILEHLEEGYELAVQEALRVASKEVIVVFFLDPSPKDEDEVIESEKDENGCTYFWNTYSWTKFVNFLAPFGYKIARHRLVTPGAAHADTIVRILKDG